MFNFLKKFPLGLDISDYSIEVLELERKFRKLYLGTYGRVKLEEGIVKDGKILHKEKLKEKIKELLAVTVPRPPEANQVILSLPESKTFLCVFKLPVSLSAKELHSTVESEALKTIPLDPESSCFDFQIVSKKKDTQEVLYAGTLREIVDEYLEVLRGVGLEPLVLDIESCSLARAFENEIMKDGGILIVDIGARTTVLTIFDQDSIRLSAIVPIAGNHFTQVISEELSISLEKAEKLKRSCGLDSEKGEGRVMLILQSVLQDILNEIKKSISFYEQKSKRKIKKILLCGGSSCVPELSSYLASNCGIETEVPDPWEGIDVEELFKKKELRKIIKTKLHPVFFANVIGLAKRGLEKDPETAGINLIPLEKRPKPTFIGRKLSKSKAFSFLVFGFVIVAFVFLGWVVYTYILKTLFP